VERTAGEPGPSCQAAPVNAPGWKERTLIFHFPKGCLRWTAAALLAAGTCSLAWGAARHKETALDLKEILSRMKERGKQLKTVSSDLEYTKVTVLVNDRSTEYGELYFRKSKNPEILLKFVKPDPKVILFRKNKAEIFLPKTNQIQEYDLEKHSGLVQQFLLLGFGTDSDDLKKSYDVKFTGEEQLGGDTAALLELTPREPSVAAQLSKIQLWISEESWLPLQQKFFEPGGDYLLTHYTSVKVNRVIPSSTFRIQAPDDAKRVKMQ
jgi:outer membrane lipoprotein-sorting protein